MSVTRPDVRTLEPEVRPPRERRRTVADLILLIIGLVALVALGYALTGVEETVEVHDSWMNIPVAGVTVVEVHDSWMNLPGVLPEATEVHDSWINVPGALPVAMEVHDSWMSQD